MKMWVRLKIKKHELELRRCWSLFPSKGPRNGYRFFLSHSHMHFKKKGTLKKGEPPCSVEEFEGAVCGALKGNLRDTTYVGNSRL